MTSGKQVTCEHSNQCLQKPFPVHLGVLLLYRIISLNKRPGAYLKFRQKEGALITFFLKQTVPLYFG